MIDSHDIIDAAFNSKSKMKQKDIDRLWERAKQQNITDDKMLKIITKYTKTFLKKPKTLKDRANDILNQFTIEQINEITSDL